MPSAVVFPGQGSQSTGFAQPWTQHPAFQIVERAEAAASVELRSLVLDPDADLSPTRSSQLSVLISSLIAWEAVREAISNSGESAPEIVGFAGHSLGQITALIASGALSLEDGIELAVARADACAAAQASEPGAMLALLGADESQARQACEATDSAWPANINGAGQVVVGGRPDALDTVAEAAERAGVRRSRKLAVDGAFHTPLMQAASDRLAPTLEGLRFREPSAPIVTNHDAVSVTGADGWPERLTTHLTNPVRWEQTVNRLVEAGADTIIEIGPGRTLTGLIRRIAPEMTTINIATPEDLKAAEELVVGVAA